MKKTILSLLLCIILPINLFAYSEYIIPGGENIGISIKTTGLVVVGFYKVNGKYIGSENLKIGDTILEIEGVEVSSINEMTQIIEKSITNNEVNIKVLRNNKIINAKLKLIKENDIYKTGLYIKDKITGIGTLSYIDPATNIYGSLGHQILMKETENNIEIKTGELYKSHVESLDRSVDGRVGSKNASLDYTEKLGTVNKNTDVGIYGNWNYKVPGKDLLKVADFNDIQLGNAYIFTTIENDTPEKFTIEIIDINENLINTNRSISFKITDEKLLEKSGGIVQGMSGSPIIQNNMIIGAVTHVIVDDVDKGYAVFIRTMLEEGER